MESLALQTPFGFYSCQPNKFPDFTHPIPPPKSAFQSRRLQGANGGGK